MFPFHTIAAESESREAGLGRHRANGLARNAMNVHGGDDGERRHPVWRTVRIIVGVALIPLGIVGLFIPVLQGVLLLLVAFTLLASDIPVIRKWRDKLRRRYPRLFRERG